MMEIPNIRILISNNINGFSGNYRLIDTYAYADDEDGTNACKFHNEDGCQWNCLYYQRNQ